AQREADRTHAILNAHVDNSPLAVIEWDDAFQVIRWSSRAEEVFGWEAGEVLNRNPRDWSFVHEEDQQRVAEIMENLIQGRVDHNFLRNRNYTRDGRVIFCEWRNSALFDAEGRLVSILSQVQDMTEEEEANRKLAEYQHRLEQKVEARTSELSQALGEAENSRDQINAILDSVAEAIIVMDSDNKITGLNPAAQGLLGMDLEDVEGRHLSYAIRDESLREKLSLDIRRAGAGSSYQFEFELRTPGEPVRLILARTSVVQDAFGRQTGVVVSLRDITVERQVDQMKTEFISTAAHELRTPLTTIQGFSEVLLTHQDLPQAEVREYLTFIHQKSLAISTIVNDLLDISRIESGKGFSLNRRVVDLVALTRRKVSEYKARDQNRQIDFIAPKGAVEALADADKVEQVLENILSNAVKYTPGGGRVSVRVESEHDVAARVVVEDEGMGMSPEQLAHVFDKFYRGDASNTNISGTGLGMSIVRYIVEAHNGLVHVNSEAGAGTTVEVVLPKGWRLPEAAGPDHTEPAGFQQSEVRKEAAT
ncbi:MAG: PAS domain-containing sensor histidine kinase, partial [Desulfovibrionaceae bacterium]